jgi:isopenicillin N synthase-like dioxygenase
VEWADLAIIDISKADTPEGRAQLTIQVRDALATTGFFYVVNHGYTPEQVRLSPPNQVQIETEYMQ